MFAGVGILGSSSAQAAPPAEDCAVAHPISALTQGAIVSGLTVERGTTPQPFSGEIIGVLKGGIAPGVDMVIAELESAAIEAAGGIWQGMSGSPVYAADGRLIGAVAYGLSYGPSPIAGITPFEEMAGHLSVRQAGRITVGPAMAKRIAERSDVTRREASAGFRELPLPISAAGIGGRQLSAARAAAKGRPYLTSGLSGAAGVARANGSGAETIVAGGNVGASYAYGDISLVGVGTATSVCAGRVVGFGHPLLQLGSTTLGLHPADALYVQPDSLDSPFKVANVRPAVGTVTDDRLTGIAGAFGALPRSAQVTSSASFEGRSRTGRTDVFVGDAVAEVALYQAYYNRDRVVDGLQRSTDLVTWRIRGAGPGGKPFQLRTTNRHAGHGLGESAAMSVAEAAWMVSGIDGARIDSVDIRSTVAADHRTVRIARIHQRRKGAWRVVDAKRPVMAKAGGRIRLRITLTGPGGRRRQAVAFAVPRRVAGQARIQVQSGTSASSELQFDRLGQARKQLAKLVRNDQLQVQFGSRDKVDTGTYAGYEESYFERRAGSFLKTKRLKPGPRVIDGSRTLKVRIR